MIELVGILKQAIMISGFVFVMMLLIEYVNVQSNGMWRRLIEGKRWRQYVFSGLLGAIPGCLGAFTVVALYSHNMITFGAVVTAMIATSGDEAFVMFAMFPQKAALITIILLGIGIIAGFLSDKLIKPTRILDKLSVKQFPLHDEDYCKCFNKDIFIPQLIHPSRYRIILIVLILLLLVALLTGLLVANAKLWIKVSIFLALAFSLFVVASVPEHFLKKHLWEHIVKMHLPRIFLWTFGTLLFFGILMNYFDVQNWLDNNMVIVMVIAVLLGIIPESGPHLVFVTLFAQGSIPFSVLLAGSVSQDGHGMLPMLAESKRSFLLVKLVNVIFGLVTGFSGLLIGL